MNRCLIAALLLIGCQTKQPDQKTDVTSRAQVPVVVVTTYPLFQMVTDMAADAVTVQWLSRDAAAPRLWTPAAADIQRLQSADRILLNGAGYEPWVQNLSLPGSRTIDTSRAYPERLLRATDVITHQHGPQGAAAEGIAAAVTWLNPELAIAQVREVERQLVQLVPKQETNIAHRADALVLQLEQMGQALDDLSAQTAGRRVFAQSSDFCYLTSRLGWKIFVASKTSAAEPTPAGASKADTTDATLKTANDALMFYNSDAPGIPPDSSIVAEDQWVAIDLCETQMAETTLWKRLNGNVRRLQLAVQKHPKP